MGRLQVPILLANPAIDEMLNRAIGSEITIAEARQLMADSPTEALVATAGKMRDRTKLGPITYSRKVFINLVNLCRDTCSYCTYKKEPGDSAVSLMNPPQVLAIAEAGKR